MGQVPVHSGDGGSGKVVAEDTNCCDRLPIESEL